MNKFSIPIVTIIIGALLFILGGLAGKLFIANISFAIDDLLINIAATFISIATVTFTYEVLGGEPISNLIGHLIKLQRVATNIDKIGIKEVVDARRKFPYEQIHEDLKSGQEMFIASRTFDSIKYNDVKILFKEFLERKEARIRILLDKNSGNLDKFIKFRETLDKNRHSRFEIRITEHLTCCIYGADYRIYVTPYLSTMRGEESPCILCSNIEKNSLYAIYKAEFYETWKLADPI